MSASLGLYRLQQVDSQIDRARSGLETIRKTLENDAELQAAVNSMETAQADYAHTKNAAKSAEAETQAQKEKIQRAEGSLYGGSVKNPKELEDLQKDIVSLKRHLTTLEERELESLLAAEEAEKKYQETKASLEIVQARLGNEHKKLIDERSALAMDMERLDQERSAAQAPIEAHLLQDYETLRSQKRGLAVAGINDGSCGACGSTINASIQQNARSSKLAYCPTCGRILYVN